MPQNSFRGRLPELSLLLFRRKLTSDFAAKVGAVPREIFPIIPRSPGSTCAFPDAPKYLLAGTDTHSFDIHGLPTTLPFHRYDVSWMIPRNYWNARHKNIYLIVMDNPDVDSALNSTTQKTKLRVDASVPMTLVTDFYCEKFETCAQCYDAPGHCRWCRNPSRNFCSHYCPPEYIKSPDACAPDSSSSCSTNML
eukprot:Gregarina_sp_Poly_1__455@NODE_110_length_13975_cov_113_221887_g97_i0_p9_GENE_NODE_110_length_13975_cov_113_221887_g97_i0NODE_110_length_13975_cov_113_221887_g97_i0_p9_ORF_typecomplete_len194_score15_30PSI_integrin/PF17205_3/0_32PSI_integrin/PF17205_3/2_6e03PSI/PF01437_25/2_8_NODE_110_length_13975_cov_113_221887_g97_i0229810